MDCKENIAMLFDVRLTFLAVGNLTSNVSDFESVRVGVRVGRVRRVGGVF